MGLSIEAGLRTESNRRIVSVATSRGEASLTSGSETILRQVLIPANTFRQGEQLICKGGGFGLSTGGVVNSFTLRVRFGSIGLSSPTIIDNTYNPNSNVVTWWQEFLLSHDISSPDFGGIGGVQFVNGATKDYNISRGEIAADFAVDNLLIWSGAVGGTGTPNFIVNETFNVVKVPSQLF